MIGFVMSSGFRCYLLKIELRITSYNVCYTKLLRKGLHYIRVQAADYVGNSSNAALQAFFCDPTPPNSNLHIGNPQFTSRDTLFVSSKTSLQLSATDESSGIKEITYTLDIV